MFSSLFYVFILCTLNIELPIRKMLQRKRESLLQLSTDNHGPQSSSLESIFLVMRGIQPVKDQLCSRETRSSQSNRGSQKIFRSLHWPCAKLKGFVSTLLFPNSTASQEEMFNSDQRIKRQCSKILNTTMWKV